MKLVKNQDINAAIAEVDEWQCQNCLDSIIGACPNCIVDPDLDYINSYDHLHRVELRLMKGSYDWWVCFDPEEGYCAIAFGSGEHGDYFEAYGDTELLARARLLIEVIKDLT